VLAPTATRERKRLEAAGAASVVRNIDQYNATFKKEQIAFALHNLEETSHKPLPYLIIRDRRAGHDLMMVDTNNVERIDHPGSPAMARAVGIPLFLAPQRPSVT